MGINCVEVMHKGGYWKIMGYSWNRRESCRAFSLERMGHRAALGIQRAGTNLQDTNLSGSTGSVLCPSVTWLEREKQRLIGLVCATQQRWVWQVDWQSQPDRQILSEAGLPSAWQANLCSALPIRSWLGRHPPRCGKHCKLLGFGFRIKNTRSYF